MRCWGLCALALGALCAGTVFADGWEQPLGREATIEVLTVDREEGGEEHWSKFWLVVLDGKPYLRLGRRGAARIEGNVRALFVSLRVGDRTIEGVRVVPAPEMAAAVAQAMARKYRLDLLIRWFPHPMTVRLEREP